jgi:CSLREA domain-containing protein
MTFWKFGNGRRVVRLVSAAALALQLVGLPLAAAPASAAGPLTLLVTSTADQPDANPGDGQCRSAADACTLRAAIQTANANAGADRIVLPAGTYGLTIPGADEEQAATGDLDVRDPLTILGAGEAATIVDGGGIDRVLHVLGGATTLRASGLTVRNGSVQGPGGGIYNAGGGLLTLSGLTLSGNRAIIALGAIGGAVATDGPARLTDVAMAGNSGERGGGGLAARGAVTLVDGSVTDNRADKYGAGIGVFGASASLNLVNSTVAENTALVDGGGIYGGDGNGLASGLGALTLSHVTVHHNFATNGAGGGVLARGPATLANVTLSANVASDGEGGGLAVGGSATLRNATVTGNGSYNGGGGIYVFPGGSLTVDNATIAYNWTSPADGGGGVYVGYDGAVSGTARLRNTIVAFNTARAPGPAGGTVEGNCSPRVTTLGSNQESGSTCGFTAAGDRSNADAGLAPLADNGGATLTHYLLTHSKAIDDGECTDGAGAAVGPDQRAMSRPRDGNLNGTARCDEGAVEIDPAMPKAPGGLRVVVATAASLELPWSDNSADETGFRIQRKSGWVDSTSSYANLPNVAANGTTVVDGGRNECTTYSYRARALKGGLESEQSNFATGTTLLKAPTGLTIASPTASGLTLNWTDASGKEEAHVVERQVDGGPFQPIAALGPNAKSYQENARPAGATFAYRVRAVALGCESGDAGGARLFVASSGPDLADSSPGDGLCRAGSGVCSLRAAVQEANARTGADAILAQAGTHQLGLAGTFEDMAATGDLDVRDGLTIVGAGTAATIVDGAQIDRVFHVLAGAPVTMRGLTVRNGLANDERGGGVYNADGSLDLVEVLLSGSGAYEGGGGLATEGRASLVDVTVDGNHGSSSGGGGVWVGGTNGQLTAQRSTISNNTVYSTGGGITSMGRPVTLTNVTISGNRNMDGQGGGIASYGGDLTLTNVTIAGNESREGGAAINASGVLRIVNSVLANNEAALNPSPDDNCVGDAFAGAVSLGGNVEDGTTCGFTAATDKSNTDPILSPLLDNGGPTLTHALMADSPAIDAGSATGCPTTDQRGGARPIDGDAVTGALCDSGAFEVKPLRVNSTLDQVDTSHGDGRCRTSAGSTVCTLRAAIQEANATRGVDAILLPAGTHGLTIGGRNEDQAATGDLDIRDHLGIAGAAVATTIVDGRQIDRVFELHGTPFVRLARITVRNGSTGEGADGAGVHNLGGQLALDRVALTGNNAVDAAGGGLSTEGPATITRSTISGNSSRWPGAGVSVGGANGALTVEASTFSGNTSMDSGGALHLDGRSATVLNSTFSGNRSLDSTGGAIEAAGPGSALTLNNVTLADNRASDLGAGAHIWVDGQLTIGNTLLAPISAGVLCRFGDSAVVDDRAGNLDGDGSCRVSSPPPADPLLGPLADNGGPTLTHALLPGSPAIDAGSAWICPATDQRGVVRPQGAACDVGAFER